VTSPEPLPDELREELEALAWGALEKKAAEEKKLRSAALNQRYREGRTEHIRSPLGDKLGTVNKSSPTPSWKVANPALVEEHIRAEFPGSVRTVYVLHTPSGTLVLQPEDELTLVLQAHAPHMLVVSDEIDPDAITALVEQSKADGVAAAPGISLWANAGVMTVRPSKDAFDAVMKLQRAGLLDLSTMQAITSGGDES
jgi:hypothetical protein